MPKGGSASRGGLHPRGGWAGLPTEGYMGDTWDTVGYGQQAGGTRPTGMYSCY